MKGRISTRFGWRIRASIMRSLKAGRWRPEVAAGGAAGGGAGGGAGGRGGRGGGGGGGGRGGATSDSAFFANPGALQVKRGPNGAPVVLVGADNKTVDLEGTEYL